MDGDEQQTAADVKRWTETYDMTEAQVLELKENFCFFDKNDEGLIPACDIANVLRALGQNPTEAESEQMTVESTQNDEGMVNFEEFMKVVGSKGLKSHPDMVEELEEALKVFDKMGLGYIPMDELKQTLASLGEPLPQEELNEMMKVAGCSAADPRINYYDFVAKLTTKDT